jgi:hypothetical protein
MKRCPQVMTLLPPWTGPPSRSSKDDTVQFTGLPTRNMSARRRRGLAASAIEGQLRPLRKGCGQCPSPQRANSFWASFARDVVSDNLTHVDRAMGAS